MSPPPRYVDDKAANMMFSPPTIGVRGPSLSSLVQTRGPPVPPKEDGYQANMAKDWAREKHAKGIRVPKDWDVERGFGKESDERPLGILIRGGEGEFDTRW